LCLWARWASSLANAAQQLLFVLSKAKLLALMRLNPGIEITLSRNLIATLSERLREANKEIGHLQKLIADIGEDDMPADLTQQ